MSSSLIDWICCPFCGGTFDADPATDTNFSILSCHCGQYPVVGGIPVLKRGIIGNSNETVDDVNGLIKAGRHQDALLCMVVPPPPPSLALKCVQSLPPVRGIRRLQNIAQRKRTLWWSKRVGAELTQPGAQTTACDLLDLYYRRSGLQWDDAYNYWGLRFGQPRHLVALSFATLVRKPTKPILDLACGFGHLTWSLLRRAQGQPVIGLDHNFIGLYVAKNFIAPEADYVCCAADGPLPFRDSFLSAAFCSDAFSFLANKAFAFRELKRLTQNDGLVLMVWMYNVHRRRPNDGLPLAPEGYRNLVEDMPHRIVADSDVLNRYLQKQGPPLARSSEMARLTDEPTVSIVASYSEDVFRDHGAFDVWPHAEGRLRLNPLYNVETQAPNQKLTLRRTFPSDYYTRDHVESKDYLPESVNAPSSILRDLAEGKRTADVERLAAQFVALGMPERYR